MIFSHWLVILSAVIAFAGSSAYIFDTLKGKTKPNRVSWFLWATAPMIGTGAALYAGADVWSTSRIFLAGFIPALVLAFSVINKKSYWQITKFDLMCGCCSVAALFFWFFADSPITAVVLAATGDGFASLPTIYKSWKYPETETGWTFLAGFLSTLIILPSITVWNIQNCIFQIYLLIINATLTILIFRRKIFKV